MTQEEKQLLLIDLCARLPYDGNLHANIIWEDGIERQTAFINTGVISDLICDEIKEIKPYLRPMSSMTDEEKKEYWYIKCPKYDDNNNIIDTDGEIVDWLNAHHFDYRGLIEKGLALEAPEGMYN